MGVGWGGEGKREIREGREAAKKKKMFIVYSCVLGDVISHLLGFSYAALPFSVPLVYQACVTWHYTWVSYWITH